MNILPSPVIAPPLDKQPVWETGIVTRGYELNRAGMVSAATLLRYCEHARWDSLKQDPALTAMFFNRDHYLVVRAQQMEVIETVGFDTALVLRLWLGGVGRTSLVFGQEVVHRDSGAVVARVRVTAVHVGGDGRPAPVPDRWRRAAGPGNTGKPRMDWPDLSPAEAHRTVVPVRLSDVDLLRHVNHAVYADIAEDAAARAMAAYWFHDGAGTPVATCHIRYLAIEYEDQAVFGDELEVFTWLEGEACRGTPCVKDCGWLTHIERRSDGRRLCRALVRTTA